jgi:hypothetical protein
MMLSLPPSILSLLVISSSDHILSDALFSLLSFHLLSKVRIFEESGVRTESLYWKKDDEGVLIMQAGKVETLAAVCCMLSFRSLLSFYPFMPFH